MCNESTLTLFHKSYVLYRTGMSMCERARERDARPVRDRVREERAERAQTYTHYTMVDASSAEPGAGEDT